MPLCWYANKQVCYLISTYFPVQMKTFQREGKSCLHSDIVKELSEFSLGFAEGTVYCVRCGGPMVSVLDSGSKGLGSWPGSLCCVLGKDTLLSQCLSTPRSINEYR